MDVYKQRLIALRALKCPVCKGQIEGIVSLHCVYNRNHYAASTTPEYESFRLNSEDIEFIDKSFLFFISQRYWTGNDPVTQTSLVVLRVDAENRVTGDQIGKKLFFDKILFDFQKTNKEKLLHRIKTILVFQ